ncbi:hypothetical protein RclHR1_05290008 [Rhizophagus clarus]|uniref:Uncharacterized protein n=1 Tax=Rhizophagus clarus TaxID=94130 RepID=A0A2Z6S3P7_9GLOM|nr:hypothetical protein RclHR1_05290008 [Rhizophagus clarus]
MEVFSNYMERVKVTSNFVSSYCFSSFAASRLGKEPEEASKYRFDWAARLWKLTCFVMELSPKTLLTLATCLSKDKVPMLSSLSTVLITPLIIMPSKTDIL